MVTLRVTVDNAAITALREHPERVRAALDRWVQRAAPYAQREMVLIIRERQSTYGRTGHLAGSVRIQPAPGGFAVGPTVAYAPFVQWPTRRHEIRARNAKALALPLGRGVFEARLGTRANQFSSTGRPKRFTMARIGGKERAVKTASGREVEFRRSVMHPGTRGLRFLEATAERVLEPLAAMLNEELAVELRSLGGGA
jgi:hypothetical protein